MQHSKKSSLWLFVKGVCATRLVEKNKYFVTNSSIPLLLEEIILFGKFNQFNNLPDIID